MSHINRTGWIQCQTLNSVPNSEAPQRIGRRPRDIFQYKKTFMIYIRRVSRSSRLEFGAVLAVFVDEVSPSEISTTVLFSRDSTNLEKFSFQFPRVNSRKLRSTKSMVLFEAVRWCPWKLSMPISAFVLFRLLFRHRSMWWLPSYSMWSSR